MRGVRLNIATGHDRPIATITAGMRALADRISPLGWHLQLFVRPNVLPDLEPIVEDMDVDVVIDHMGLVPGEGYRDNPGFSALQSMLIGGRSGSKASGAYRVGSAEGPWDGVAPTARTLIESRRTASFGDPTGRIPRPMDTTPSTTKPSCRSVRWIRGNCSIFWPIGHPTRERAIAY